MNGWMWIVYKKGEILAGWFEAIGELLVKLFAKLREQKSLEMKFFCLLFGLAVVNIILNCALLVVTGAFFWRIFNVCAWVAVAVLAALLINEDD